MKKPLIGITPGEIYNREYPFAPVAYGQMHTYIDMIIRAGGVPFVFPLTKDNDTIDQLCDLIDGLLLSGGNDINPTLYNEKSRKTKHEASGLRDLTENRILENTLKTNKPILGICRGLQFLNVYFGGSLYQDIKTELPNALNHELSTDLKDNEHKAHPIHIEKDSRLSKILGTTEIETNTHHHQCIKVLGNGLRSTAKAPDGVIEAIESEDEKKFIVAVQSHPESLSRVLPTWVKLFEAFVKEAVKK